MFITGPQVIKQVTGETVSAEDLGGAVAQMNNSGVVHLLAQNDDEAMYLCRRLLSFLPSNNMEDPPRLRYDLPHRIRSRVRRFGARRYEGRVRHPHA